MLTNKQLVAKTIFTLMLTPLLSSTAFADEAPATEVVVATVNGDKIMKSTFDGYMSILKKSGKPDRQAAINDLVSTEIALQEAAKTDILERPASKKAIKDFTRNLLLKTWTSEKVRSFDVSEEAIKTAYDERVTKLASKEFNARHILVKTEDEAKAIIVELDGGADFEKLAKDKSTGPSGSNGGSLGWFKAQTMVPAFANAVKEMEKGKFSSAPVKTQFGFHIIKLEDSRDAKLPTVESLTPQLKRVISQKKMLDYMKELGKTADVKITLPEEKPAETVPKLEKKD
jgi:peptidyl-prolyl cis-trans isomerase C